MRPNLLHRLQFNISSILTDINASSMFTTGFGEIMYRSRDIANTIFLQIYTHKAETKSNYKLVIICLFLQFF